MFYDCCGFVLLQHSVSAKLRVGMLNLMLNGSQFPLLCNVKLVAKVWNRFLNRFCYRHSKPLTAHREDACNRMSDAVIKWACWQLVGERGWQSGRAASWIRVSNTPGNPGNLLEITKVSWKFSGWLKIPVLYSVPVKTSCSKPGLIDIGLSIPSKCPLTELLLG